MPTLNKAVEGTVANLIADKKTFSAHDVTQAIRKESNLGNYHIDSAETGTIYVHGGAVPQIKHSLVRECVHDIFNCGSMPGYERSFNGQYMEYREEVAPVVSASDDDSDDDSDDVSDTDSASALDTNAADGDVYDGSSPLSN
jgi:hypothetical protein